jgi:hypothetical protein
VSLAASQLTSQPVQLAGQTTAPFSHTARPRLSCSTLHTAYLSSTESERRPATRAERVPLTDPQLAAAPSPHLSYNTPQEHPFPRFRGGECPARVQRAHRTVRHRPDPSARLWPPGTPLLGGVGGQRPIPTSCSPCEGPLKLHPTPIFRGHRSDCLERCRAYQTSTSFLDVRFILSHPTAGALGIPSG